jgi:hypothetical protein
MFVNIVKWRVPKENSKKQFELWNEIMEYQSLILRKSTTFGLAFSHSQRKGLLKRIGCF